jgi:hypothetical protein
MNFHGPGHSFLPIYPQRDMKYSAVHKISAADQQKHPWHPQGTLDQTGSMSDNQLLETQGPEARGEYPDLELYDTSSTCHAGMTLFYSS